MWPTGVISLAGAVNYNAADDWGKGTTMTPVLKRCSVAILGLAATFALGGCDIFRDRYVWVRDDGDTFEMSYRVNQAASRVIMLERYVPGKKSQASGVLDAGRKYAVTDKSYLEDCTVVNEKNWVCRPSSDTASSEVIQMSDGDLTYSYWDEFRVYKKRRTLAW